MFPPPRSRLKSGETRTPATGKHSGTDNREGRADRRLCSGVKGPPWRGSLAPRTDFMLQGTSEPQAPPPPGRRRGPGSRPVNLAGTAKESDGRGMGGGGLRRRRLPGPLPARDSCRRPHGAPRDGARVEVRAPRGSRPAPSGPGIPPQPRCAPPARVGTAGGSAGRTSARRPMPGGRGTAAKLTPTSQAARARRGSRPRRPAPREAGPPGCGAAEGLSPRALAKMPP